MAQDTFPSVGISPEESVALREMRRDFLSLSELEAANLLLQLSEARIASRKAFQRAKSDARVEKVLSVVMEKMEGMSAEERSAFLAEMGLQP